MMPDSRAATADCPARIGSQGDDLALAGPRSPSHPGVLCAEEVDHVLVGYVARRLLGAIPVLIGVSAVVFLAMQLVPGDIA